MVSRRTEELGVSRLWGSPAGLCVGVCSSACCSSFPFSSYAVVLFLASCPCRHHFSYRFFISPSLLCVCVCVGFLSPPPVCLVSPCCQDYPTEEQVEYDVYDQSTDDEGGLLGDDDDEDGDGDDGGEKGVLL